MKRRVLFDVGHPAQVHNFKHVYWELAQRGWEGLFTAKDKEVALDLLRIYQLPYKAIGKSRGGLLSKIASLLGTCIAFMKILREFKPDVVICRFSPHACWCSRLLGIPIIGLTDTEHIKLLDSVTVPFASAKLTAFSYGRDLGRNHFRFNGNIELFYLHPNRFTRPVKPLDSLGVKENEKYALLRFVSWSAHHDVGEKGLSFANKLEMVQLLSQKYRVFISSEKELPAELKPYQVKISPEQMHDVIACAAIYIGEGASMASESACLGIPSLYINSLEVGNVKEEQAYGLAYHFTNWPPLKDKLMGLLADSDPLLASRANLKNFLADKIDVTAFLVWFIESYPQSAAIMKENPDYQYRFR